MNGYRMKVMDVVSQIEHDFKDYIPSSFPRNFFGSDMSDEALYFLASIWRDATVRNRQNGNGVAKDAEKDEKIWLEPYTYGDTICIVDRNRNKVRDVIQKNSNGLSYFGYKSDITKYGGRGELHQIGADIDDGRMFSGY